MLRPASIARLLLLTAALGIPAATGCKGSTETTPPTTQPSPVDTTPGPTATVTPDDGGEASLPLEDGDGVEVAIPAGAVNEDTDVAVATTDPEDVAEVTGDATLVSEPVAFTPHGTTFDTPVTIAFTIAGGVPEGSVMLKLDDESDTDWALVPSTVAGDVISAEVTSFSIYVVARGDVCHEGDPDSDGDGECDSEDACPDPNDPDSDDDGLCDSVDPCPDPNDPDSDGDDICDSVDPCPDPNDPDSDGDDICDSVDPCPDPNDPDSDGDDICDSVDNCNGAGTDSDGNGVCDQTEARIGGTILENSMGVAGAIQLYDNNQQVVATGTSASDGSYFFGNLPAGTYFVYVSDQAACLYGSSDAIVVSLGDYAMRDVTAGCN